MDRAKDPTMTRDLKQDLMSDSNSSLGFAVEIVKRVS